MNEIGFVKIDRTILSWRWYKNVNTFKVFLHLILTANFVDYEFEEYTIKRGQVVTGLNKLSHDTGLSVQQVRTALNHLKSTNDITIKTTSKYSIITIVRYEQFQDATSTLTRGKQTTNTQLTSDQQQYKKNKKNKNNNKYNNRGKMYEVNDELLAAFEEKSMFKD